MQKQTTSTKTRGPKITAEILKFSDHEAGFTFQGKYLEKTERPWMDKESGEEKIIPVFQFETDKGTRVNVFGDAGLVNAINGASVKPGQWIEIEKAEQIELKGGRRVNQYEIYELN